MTRLAVGRGLRRQTSGREGLTICVKGAPPSDRLDHIKELELLGRHGDCQSEKGSRATLTTGAPREWIPAPSRCCKGAPEIRREDCARDGEKGLEPEWARIKLAET